MRSRLRGLLAVFLVAGCGALGGPTAAPSPTSTPVPPTDPPLELTIYGASSLRGLLEAAKAAYERATPGIRLIISTDSSAALATKIEQGAPADLFLSADTTNPDRLATAGLTAAAPTPFASNQLAIVMPIGNPAEITSPEDLVGEGVRIVAAGDEVPITGYADELIANLASEPGYPDDFADAYAGNVVSKEENVAAIMTRIELGEGDAAIVYATDAAASSDVEVVEIPAGRNVRGTYAAVVVKASPHQPEAQAFLDWLLGLEGASILQGLGFMPPPE